MVSSTAFDSVQGTSPSTRAYRPLSTKGWPWEATKKAAMDLNVSGRLCVAEFEAKGERYVSLIDVGSRLEGEFQISNR